MWRLMLVLGVGVLAGCKDAKDVGVLPTAPSLAASAPEEIATAYSVRLLPTLPMGRSSRVLAINSHGVAVGESDWNSSLGCNVPVAAVVWEGNTVRNLHRALADVYGYGDPLPWPTCAPGLTSALDINDLGDVIVASSFSGDNFFWLWNAKTGFGWGGYWGRIGGAFSINNRREIVGYFDDGFVGIRRAHYWSPSTGDLDIHPGEQYIGSMAYDISDDGEVFGCVDGWLARWRVGGAPTLSQESCNGEDMQIPVGVMPRPIAGASRGGRMAASTTREGSLEGVVWWGLGMARAGWGFGSASAISDGGRAVGWSYASSLSEPRAVTRYRTGPVRFLPVVSSTRTSRAYDVNRCGHVAGSSYDSEGRQRATVWLRRWCDGEDD